MLEISEAISCCDYEKALRLIHDYVEDIITEPFCAGRVFGSKELDSFCELIGRSNYNTIKSHTIPKTETETHIIIYIVTKLKKTGGHTRVIKDFINLMPNCSHYILSTEISGRSDFEYFKDSLFSCSNVVIECAPNSSFLNKLSWLQHRLISINSKKVYLFNHHQDSVAVASIQSEMKLDAYFYHHADHHFCLGIFLSFLKHIDPHPMGFHNCRNELGINNIYVPLTVVDRKPIFAGYKFLSNKKLTTCTAANSNKTEIPYFISYMELVPELIKSTGGKHIHIGRLTPWALYKIRRGMLANSIDPSRFIYIPWVPSVWVALVELHVDLYIASFPYGGGLTLIEAMGAGVPIAVHQHKFVNFLSGLELAYPEAFVWRYPNELLTYCKNLSLDQLINSAHSARSHYENFYSENHLSNFLRTDTDCSVIPEKRLNVSLLDSVEFPLVAMQHFTITHIIIRKVYRLVRKLRDAFF